jgi:hypothetical protein
MSLLEELTSGPLAAELAPHIAAGTDGEIPGVWVTLATLELGDLINTTIIDSPDLIVSDFSFLLSSLVPSEINSSGGRLTLN